jgi:two-component system, chemotaxis family, sensor kinase CheA
MSTQLQPAIGSSSIAVHLDEIATTLLLENSEEISSGAVDRLGKEFATLRSTAVEINRSDIATAVERLEQQFYGEPELRKTANLMQQLEALQEICRGESAGCEQAIDSLAQDPEMVSEFIVESREHLSNIESLSLQLEQDPSNSEAIHSLFRSFHSMKGLAAFLELHRIQKFAHEVESLLDLVREGQLAVGADLIDVVLASKDFLARCVDAVETNSLNSIPGEELQLVSRIRVLGKGQPNTPSISGEAAQSNPSESQREHGPTLASVPNTPASAPGDGAAEEVRAETSALVDTPREAQAAKKPASENLSVRVDTAKLDHLMDMVGEMVIAESLIRTELTTEHENNQSLQRKLSQLAHITSEVQRTTMGLRLVPIGPLFIRTSRIARDLAKKFGKLVEIEFIGEETEVDKGMLEELTDPLMYMVRNAIDHGIEEPEARVRAGKSQSAKLVLAAYHQGSQIVVEIRDDGRGLDPDKILNKARQKGLVGDQPLEKRQILELIFMPGFSTAEQVTAVSGRGVGMDVVRRQLEKMRGSIDTESVLGSGTTFKLKLPLTRAIIDGLVVSVGSSKYVVPVSYVREIFRPTTTDYMQVHAREEMVRFHDRLVPVMRLHSKLNVHTTVKRATEAVLVVVDVGGKVFALMVDQLIGKQEIVIKALGSALRNARGVSGATILGDGRVGLILDLHALGGTSNA